MKKILLMLSAVLLLAACSKDDDNSQNVAKDATNNTNDISLSASFSVSSSKKVSFSKGNLQYNASNNTWRFASNQWDYVGADNQNYCCPVKFKIA